MSENKNVPEAPSIAGLNLNPKPVGRCMRTKYKSAEEDLDMVAPNLYIGSLDAAMNVELLKKLNITHILTVENSPLIESVQKEFTYKFKRLFDLPSSNILDILAECIEFIESGLQNSTGVLVHCLVGVSRSASIVIGYLMSKEKKSLSETIEFVRKNRFVRPNTGFKRQLEYFEAMDFKLENDSSIFRAFKLEKMADLIQRGCRFEELYIPTEDHKEQDNLACYKCKKCRFKLFTIDQTVGHVKGSEFGSDFKHKHEFYAKSQSSTENGALCEEEIYIEPLDWLQTRLSDISGKINCPKCDAKLGSFDWSGGKCACGTWVTPAIHISKSKVDFNKPI